MCTKQWVSEYTRLPGVKSMKQVKYVIHWHSYFYCFSYSHNYNFGVYCKWAAGQWSSVCRACRRGGVSVLRRLRPTWKPFIMGLSPSPPASCHGSVWHRTWIGYVRIVFGGSDRCRATHLELPKTRGTGPESRPL